MNKQEQKELSLKIKEELKKVSTYDTETLNHYYKIVLSKNTAIEKKLYNPLLKEIEKEKKKRGITNISASIVPIKGKKK